MCSSPALAQSNGAQDFPQEATPEHASRNNQCPRHVGGDREFNGNGPRVNFSSELTLANDQKSVISKNLFNARETRGDRTEAEVTAVGPSSTLHEFTPWEINTQCLLIDAITGPNQNSLAFTDTDHALDDFSFADPSYVSLLRVKGDTSGRDTRNCTNDDTKYHVRYNPMGLRVDLDPNQCRKPDGTPPEVTKVEGDPVLDALNAIAGATSLRLDNVEFSTGSAVFDPNESFFALALGGGLSLVTNFSIDPVQEGRYTIFVDDINSTQITIEPDGGGYMMNFQFEMTGTELRSSCQVHAVTLDGEFVSLESIRIQLGLSQADFDALTQADLEALLEADLQVGSFTDHFEGWAQCELGNELTVNLDRLDASIRLIPEVVNGNLQLRPIDPANPLRDIFVEVGVSGQNGPCHENVFAIAHDCNEVDEWETILEFEIARAIRAGLEPALADPPNSMVGPILSAITSAIGSPTNLVGVYVADGEGHVGDIYVFTN